jgi:hypothetical protein
MPRLNSCRSRRTTYGIELKSRSTKLDVGKMIRDDFHYVDSNEVAGIQVADLLAAGLRRLLRGGFEERTNDVARSFGANTLQGLRGEYPVNRPPRRPGASVAAPVHVGARHLDHDARGPAQQPALPGHVRRAGRGDAAAHRGAA